MAVSYNVSGLALGSGIVAMVLSPLESFGSWHWQASGAVALICFGILLARMSRAISRIKHREE